MCGLVWDVPDSLAKMLAQIWHVVQCMSKSIFVLEQKKSIINFDMNLLRDNVSKVCDLLVRLGDSPSRLHPHQI